MIQRTLLALLMLCLLASCAMPEKNMLPDWLGYKRVLLRGAPQGDDSFSQGWRDGCDTSLATVGTGTLRLVKQKMNGAIAEHLVNDPLYEKGYSTGSGYCANFLDYNSG